MTKSEKVVVYTMKYCPFCVAAKKLLEQRGIKFTEILVDDDDDKTWDELYRRTGMRTMPQIFNGDDVIGGYDELSSLDREDKLSSLKG